MGPPIAADGAPPELFIFDLDGTLIDSRADIVASLNRARAGFGLPPLDDDVAGGFIGDGVQRLLERGLATTDPNVIARALAVFRAHYDAHCLDRTALYPDVPEVLDVLEGRVRAIVTNKPEPFARKILAGLGVEDRFEFVLGGDTTPAKKPDPAGILDVLRRAGKSPAQALVVGDALQDLEAARAAGVRAALVTYGIGREADLRAAGPDLLLRRLAELPARVGIS